MLTKESLFNAGCRTEKVKMNDDGGYVCVKSISGNARIRLEELYTNEATTEDVMTLVISESVCDELGNLMIKPEEVATLLDKQNEISYKLFFAALKVSGLTAKSIEEAEKN